MRIHLPATLCFLLVFTAKLPAGDAPADRPKSPQAIAALTQRDAAIAKAKADAADVEAGARRQYAAELSNALAEAKAAKQQPATDWLQAEIDRIEHGQPLSPGQPRVDSAISPRLKYVSAVDAGKQEMRRKTDAARRTYAADLDTARTTALVQLKDLDEANRIAAEIERSKLPAAAVAETARVNLVSIVDPARDALVGDWRVNDGVLQSTPSPQPRRTIEFPYVPPEEYDYKLTFKYGLPTDAMAQICAVGNRQFAFLMACGNNKVCLIGNINNHNWTDNPTYVKTDRPAWFTDGRTYTSVVKVRRNSIQAFIDDELIASWKTKDYSDLSLDPYNGGGAMRHTNVLAYGVYGDATQILKAEVTERSGAGKLLQANRH